MGKQIKGEKFIYLLMAYERIKNGTGKLTKVGDDSGIVGGYNFQRIFTLYPKASHLNEDILVETKSSPHCANFSRSFVIRDNGGKFPIIREHLNEHNENGSKHWIH